MSLNYLVFGAVRFGDVPAYCRLKRSARQQLAVSLIRVRNERQIGALNAAVIARMLGKEQRGRQF